MEERDLENTTYLGGHNQLISTHLAHIVPTAHDQQKKYGPDGATSLHGCGCTFVFVRGLVLSVLGLIKNGKCELLSKTLSQPANSPTSDHHFFG